MTEEQKAFIDGASYTHLLSLWRHAPAGSPWFQGEVGEYFQTVMAQKKAALTHEERVSASKTVGWDA